LSKKWFGNKPAVFATYSRSIEPLGGGIQKRRKKKNPKKENNSGAEDRRRKTVQTLSLSCPSYITTTTADNNWFFQLLSTVSIHSRLLRPPWRACVLPFALQAFELAHRRLLCPRLRQLFSRQQRCSGTIVAWWGATLAFSHAMHDSPQRITITLPLRWTGPRPPQRGPALPQDRTYVQNSSTSRAAASPCLWPQPH